MYVYSKRTIEYVFNERNAPKDVWCNLKGTLRPFVNFSVLHNVRFYGYFDLTEYQITVDYTEYNERKSISDSKDTYGIIKTITPCIKHMERETNINNILK
jgi:hypothetical protein